MSQKRGNRVDINDFTLPLEPCCPHNLIVVDLWKKNYPLLYIPVFSHDFYEFKSFLKEVPFLNEFIYCLLMKSRFAYILPSNVTVLPQHQFYVLKNLVQKPNKL